MKESIIRTKRILCYCNESEVTGMDGKNTLKVSDGIATLMRVGSVPQFVFQEGRKHISYYDTTYGAFTIGVFANEVNVNMDDCGGEIMSTIILK